MRIDEILNTEDAPAVSNLNAIAVASFEEANHEVEEARNEVDECLSNIVSLESAEKFLTQAIQLEQNLAKSENLDAKQVNIALESAQLFASETLGMTLQNMSFETIESGYSDALSISLEEKQSKLRQIIEWIKKMLAKAGAAIKKLFNKVVIAVGNNEKVAKNVADEVSKLKNEDLLKDVLDKTIEKFALFAALNGGSIKFEDLVKAIIVYTGKDFSPKVKNGEISFGVEKDGVQWYKGSDINKFFTSAEKDAEYFPLTLTGTSGKFLTKKKDDNDKVSITISTLSIDKKKYEDIKLIGGKTSNVKGLTGIASKMASNLKDAYKKSNEGMEAITKGLEDLEKKIEKEEVDSNKKAMQKDIDALKEAARIAPSIANSSVMGYLSVSRAIIASGKATLEKHGKEEK